MPKAKATLYRVLNPHGHPPEVNGERVHIIAYQPTGEETPLRWYEGDVFEAPAGMNTPWLLEQGYLEEVKGG